VLPLKLLSPEYLAVIRCAPTLRDDRVRLAALPLTGPEPILVAPSKKATVPVTEPEYCGVMVAVKVTARSRSRPH
jgi:hypothetical protein